MTTPCKHGFLAHQCASCRIAGTATAVRRGAPTTASVPSAEQHLGYEIFYVPAVSGWQYRGPDSNPSPLSYRSAFLARKAVADVAARSSAKASVSADSPS
jgi:hypothetical protein